MMQRRRMMMQGSAELYPVGTDIIGNYIGRDKTGKALFNQGYGIDTVTGEYKEANYSSSTVFMRIDPKYQYQKNIEGRIYVLAYYDAGYNYLGYIVSNNLRAEILPAPPANAVYARVATHYAQSNWKLAITRIA